MQRRATKRGRAFHDTNSGGWPSRVPRVAAPLSVKGVWYSRQGGGRVGGACSCAGVVAVSATGVSRAASVKREGASLAQTVQGGQAGCRGWPHPSLPKGIPWHKQWRVAKQKVDSWHKQWRVVKQGAVGGRTCSTGAATCYTMGHGMYKGAVDVKTMSERWG